MTLTPAKERFIASWPEMASKWCFNRTVAQVHAFFFLSANPLNAEDVADTSAFSRSNVSACLRGLERRELIRPIHFRGDRKQYYEAIKDPWGVFRTIVDDQRRRVIDPTVAVFGDCLDKQKRRAPEDSYAAERMRDVVSFFNAIDLLYKELRRLPSGSIQNLSDVAARIREVRG